MKQYFVYILTNKNNKVLYTGVTSDLIERIYQHKEKLVKGFTSRYNVDKLVYYEIFEDISEAISREKQIKNWHKDWKWNLIKEKNPELLDLRHRFE